jgi:phosphoglycolate phosphatase
MEKPFLIFDFDGTIGDTAEMILGVVNRLAMEKGRPPLTDSEKNVFLSSGAKAFLKSQNIRFWELPGYLKKGRAYFAESADKILLVSGIKEILIRLHEEGFRMGIVTSNSESVVRKLLSDSGIIFFDFIFSEKGLFGKDKVIKRAMKENGIGRENAIYIGDEIRDISAAERAEIKMIAVSWGMNGRGAFESRGIKNIADDPESLLRIISS